MHSHVKATVPQRSLNHRRILSLRNQERAQAVSERVKPETLYLISVAVESLTVRDNDDARPKFRGAEVILDYHRASFRLVTTELETGKNVVFRLAVKRLLAPCLQVAR